MEFISFVGFMLWLLSVTFFARYQGVFPSLRDMFVSEVSFINQTLDQAKRAGLFVKIVLTIGTEILVLIIRANRCHDGPKLALKTIVMMDPNLH